MQTYRIIPRSAPRACRAAASCNNPSSSSRAIFTTPFFPGSHHYNPVAELGPLFRVLDSAVADFAPERTARHLQRQRSFTPRFDVKEVGSTYELQGELPGLEQKDVEIEFADERTLVIRGKSVREYQNSNVEEQTQAAGTEAPAVEGAQDNNATITADNASDKSGSYHKASVEEGVDEEDDFVDAGAEAESSDVAKGKAPESTPAAAATEMKKQSEPEYKYWIHERSVGQFERRFAFPGRVDQEAVKASLRNGILSVVVPKIVSEGVRKVEIQ